MTVWRGRASKGESVSHQVAAWSSLIGVVASLLVMVQVVSAPQALAAGANPYQNAVLANDPVMYVPFDQYGAVPQDSNTFNIAPGGTPGGASMTGSFTRYEPGALLSSPTAPSVGLSGGNATMLGTDGWHNSQVSFELWFKTTAGPTGSTQPLLFDQSANNGGFVQLSIDGSGLLVGTVNTAIDPYNLGDRQNLSVAGSQVADGAWHHAVFEVQQSAVTDIQLYIDGTPVPVQTTARQIVWLVGNNSASNGYVGGNGFSGWVDEFAVYKHALSLSQVRGDYAASGRTPPPLSLVGGPLVSTEMRSPSNDTPVCDCAKPITLPFGTFHHEWTDFAIPGRGAALSLQHTYTTALASSDGPLGYGWDFSYDAKLSVDPGTQAVTVAEGGGTAVKFTLQPTGGYLPAAPRTFASLTHNGDGSWTMVRQGTETLSFNSTGQLAQIMDRNQFATRLAYDGNGHLSTVTDPANRTLTFTWTGTHITAVSDPSTPARTVAFGYDGAGNLTDYTDVAVGNWHYTYDPSHRLLTMRDPRQVNANPPVAVSNVYDGQGRVTSQTDQLNRTTGFDYTTVPGAVIVTDPQLNKTLKQFSTDNVLTDETRGYGTPVAATWHYTYDPASAEVETVTDPNQHVTSFVYDDKGNRVRSSDPLGRTATAVFNSFNEPLKTTDGNGVTTTNVYDGYGNLTSTATPLDLNNTRTTTYTYDADPTRRSDVISMVDPNQKTWSYHYNANGDRDAVTDPLGNKTTTTFNNVGWPLSTVSPRGNVTGGNPALFTTTFDAYTAFGDLKHTTDPLGHTSAKDYDANRNVSSTTDSDNNTTTYVYDAENQQTEIHRADTSVLYTSYRADGRLQTQTDAAGHHTDYDYDAQGRLSTVTDPLGAVTTYGYDAVGNQTQQQDPGGNCGTNLQCTTMGYDADNELTSITYSDGVTPNVSSIGYDNNGRKTFAVDSFGTSSWGYDALGRLISSSTPAGGTVTYGYDLKGQVTSIGYPNTGTVTRTYDDAGRLTTVSDWMTPANTTTFNYDVDSNLTSQVFPNSTTATNSFDNAGRLMGISDAPTATPNSPYASFAYGRDNNSQLTSVTSTGVPTDNHTWTYNTLNQLKTDSANSFSFNYDTSDNLTQLNAAGVQKFNDANQVCWAGPGTGTEPCTAAPSSATTFQYDARGNRTLQTSSTGKPTTYGYDQANRLTTVSTTISGPLLAAGTADTYAIRSNDTLTGYGADKNGEVGNGTTNTTGLLYDPAEVTVQSATAVAASRSGSHALAVKPDGKIVSWGLNSSGQLGIGSTASPKTSPQNVTGNLANTTVVAVAAGATSSYALTADGHVYAWGGNSNGQLGLGNTTTQTSPQLINTLSNVVAITAGANHAMALTSGGQVYAWGLNSSSQLGDNTTTKRTAPVLVQQAPTFNGTPTGPLTGVVSISAGATHSLAIKADGSLWEWGENSSHQLGHITASGTVPTTDGKTATQLPNFTGAKTAAGGLSHTLVLKTDGTLYAWGLNSSKQLGMDATNTTTQIDPVQVNKSGGTALTGIVAIAAGDKHSTAVTNDGTVWGWGANANGQLGLTGMSTSTGPAQAVQNLNVTTARQLASYTYDTQGLRATKITSAGTQAFTWDVAEGLPLLLADGTADYVYGPGGVPLEQINGTTVLYYNHDQLGSTRVLTNSTGAVAATYTYEDWGRLTASTGSVTNPFGYAGQYTDPETGLQYLRARYYDPATGQFLSRDPALASTRDAYGYATRSPVNVTDPSGLHPTNPDSPGGPPTPMSLDQVKDAARLAGLNVDDYELSYDPNEKNFSYASFENGEPVLGPTGKPVIHLGRPSFESCKEAVNSIAHEIWHYEVDPYDEEGATEYGEAAAETYEAAVSPPAGPAVEPGGGAFGNPIGEPGGGGAGRLEE